MCDSWLHCYVVCISLCLRVILWLYVDLFPHGYAVRVCYLQGLGVLTPGDCVLYCYYVDNEISVNLCLTPKFRFKKGQAVIFKITG